MFEIKHLDPQTYRRQTRRSTLIIAVMFAVLAVLFSSVAVALFGESGGDNFRLNVVGVVAGLLLTIALVRLQFWSQPWMAPAVYGWQLKRNLMRITNVMHHVSAGVLVSDPMAMKLLRFYHIGITQMHQLDANSSAHLQMIQEINQHEQRMIALSIDPDQTQFDPAWIDAIKHQA